MAIISLEGISQMDFRASEAFKILRTNIKFCGDAVRVIALTSCTPNEGKSSVSLNLAMSLAEEGKKVLLLDSDLRKSVLAGRLRIRSTVKGLSHFLSGQCSFEEIVYATSAPSLFMALAGPIAPNPAELLGGKRFRDMLEKAKKDYDYVIIDTPPLGSVIDAAIISSQCDGVAIVVETGVVSYKFVQDIKEQLEKTNCKILGVILNKVDISKKGYYGRHYGKYYGKYYGDYYGGDSEK